MKKIYILLIATMLSITAMSQIITTGLVAYYPFNGNANDSSGHGYNGTIYGATLTTDRFGNPNSAYNFSPGDYIIVNSMPFNSSFTVCGYVCFSGFSAGGSYCTDGSAFLSHKDISSYGDGWYLGEVGGLFHWYFATGGVGTISQSLTTLQLTRWYFFSWTNDGAGNNKLYLNDTLISTGSGSAPSSNYSFVFGKEDDYHTECLFNGKLDDILYYNRALSDTEITEIYNSLQPISCPTPTPITTNVSRCGAGALTLNASGGTQYIWYNAPSGGSVVNIGPTFHTPTLSTTTTYYVTNFDSCESSRVPAIAHINNLHISATNQTISCGDTVTLNPTVTYNGSNTLTYAWTPATGLSSTSIKKPVASPAVTTTYTVMVTDSVCSSFDNVTVIVNPASFGVSFTANTEILYSPPFAIQFNNTTSTLSDYNFTWFFGDGDSLQSNSATLFHTYLHNGLYNVTLIARSIATGCTQTDFQSGYIYLVGGTSCSQTANIMQSNPVNGCVGTPVMLSCNTVSGATYQWNYDGVAISGYDTTVYYANAPGNYSVTIIVDTCPVTSSIVTVNFHNTPEIPIITATGSITYCGSGSVTLSDSTTANSYLWSNGATTQSTTVTTSGNYTLQITDANGCTSQSLPYLVGASPLGNPDICMVGVDSATGHNIIIWNKPVTTAIDHYNVYGEGTLANVFDLLGSVPYSSMSTYIDYTSIPTQQSYLYELSAVDTCGAETALSNYHETIHLSINQGMGTTYNLMWNYYEGFTFPSYKIYRGTNPLNMTLLTTLASTLNSYTDLTPPAGYVYYQIEAVNPSPCTPTARVMSTSNYNSSKSNIASNNPSGISNYKNNTLDISIYPNPANESVTIEVPQKAIIEILNIQGQLIKTLATTGNKTNIDVSLLARGMYFVKVKTEKGVAVKKFIKE